MHLLSMRAPAKHPRYPATPASARRRSDTTSPIVERIKRPSNAFILYRSAKCKELRALADQKDVSKVVGQMWAALSPAEKQPWKDLAKEKAHQHRELYPTYKFKPRPKAPATTRTTYSNGPRCTELFKKIAAGKNEGGDVSAYIEQVDLVKAEIKTTRSATKAKRGSKRRASSPTDFSSPSTDASSPTTLISSPFTSASDLMPPSSDYPYVAQMPAIYAPIPIHTHDQPITTTTNHVPESPSSVHAYNQNNAHDMVPSKYIEPYYPTAYVPDLLPQHTEVDSTMDFFPATTDLFLWDPLLPPPPSQDLDAFLTDVNEHIAQWLAS